MKPLKFYLNRSKNYVWLSLTNMEHDKMFKKFSKENNSPEDVKSQAVIYTRVSTKEQADNNASLSTQMKHCKK